MKNTIYIKNMAGKAVEVTDLDKAIEECEFCEDSPFKMEGGYTVGQDHKFMLGQLKSLKNKENFKINGE